MTKSAYLLHALADALDCDIDEVLENATFDSVCPGICSSCECIVDACEPDAEDNYCDGCDAPTVKSALVLAGVL